MTTRNAVAERFNDSLTRCNQNELFIKTFYQRFLLADPEVLRLFARTNMQQQETMLRASLYMMMLTSETSVAKGTFLSHTAAAHDHRQVPSYLYDVWLECLIATVAEIDPHFSELVESDWRTTMRAGLNYMKSAVKFD